MAQGIQGLSLDTNTADPGVSSWISDYNVKNTAPSSLQYNAPAPYQQQSGGGYGTQSSGMGGGGYQAVSQTPSMQGYGETQKTQGPAANKGMDQVSAVFNMVSQVITNVIQIGEFFKNIDDGKFKRKILKQQQANADEAHDMNMKYQPLQFDLNEAQQAMNMTGQAQTQTQGAIQFDKALKDDQAKRAFAKAVVQGIGAGLARGQRTRNAPDGGRQAPAPATQAITQPAQPPLTNPSGVGA